VARLEDESKRLYGIIDRKDRDIKKMQLEAKVQWEENKRLTAQVKELIRAKSITDTKLEEMKTKTNTCLSQSNANDQLTLCNSDGLYRHHKFFATEVVHESRPKGKQSFPVISGVHKVMQRDAFPNRSEQSISCPEEEDFSQLNSESIRKKLVGLAAKNRKLTKFISKIL
jgi:hypothetical protein